MATDIQPTGFNYHDMEPSLAAELQTHRDNIFAVEKQALIDIGRELAAVQAKLANYSGGTFVEWANSETGFSKSSVYNAINAYNRFGSFPNFGKLALNRSITYLLSDPKVSDEVVEDVISRLEKGQKMTVDQVRLLIGKPVRTKRPNIGRTDATDAAPESPKPSGPTDNPAQAVVEGEVVSEAPAPSRPAGIPVPGLPGVYRGLPPTNGGIAQPGAATQDVSASPAANGSDRRTYTVDDVLRAENARLRSRIETLEAEIARQQQENAELIGEVARLSAAATTSPNGHALAPEATGQPVYDGTARVKHHLEQAAVEWRKIAGDGRAPMSLTDRALRKHVEDQVELTQKIARQLTHLVDQFEAVHMAVELELAKGHSVGRLMQQVNLGTFKARAVA